MEGIHFEGPKEDGGRYCLNWMSGFLFQEGLPYFSDEEEMLEALRKWLAAKEYGEPELRIEWIDQEVTK
jgi:hypothetical protein